MLFRSYGQESTGSNILIIFTLALNDSHPVLSTNPKLVDSFSRYFNEVYVFAVHLGNFTVPGNVRVFELGGGSITKRIKAIARSLKSIAIVLSSNSQVYAFHHMSTKTLLIPGLLLRVLKVRQYLWYSHSKYDVYLSLFARVANKAFSPGLSTFPRVAVKTLEPVGHMIDFPVSHEITARRVREAKQKEVIGEQSLSILTVGRIAPIKKLEEAIFALAAMEKRRSLFPTPSFTILGPVQDSTYKNYLYELSRKLGVNLYFLDYVPHSELWQLYFDYDVYFQGTPNSVDKATLEASGSGCIPISTNQEVLKMTGMDSFNQEFMGELNPSLVTQIENLMRIKNERSSLLTSISVIVSQQSISRNSLDDTVSRMTKSMKHDF